MGLHKANQCVHIGSPWRKIEKGAVSLFQDIITENVPNLGTKIDIQIHEAQQIPKMLNLKWGTVRHIIIELLKSRGKFLKH